MAIPGHFNSSWLIQTRGKKLVKSFCVSELCSNNSNGFRNFVKSKMCREELKLVVGQYKSQLRAIGVIGSTKAERKEKKLTNFSDL